MWQALLLTQHLQVLDYIVAHGTLPEKEVRKYIHQLASAVSHLHSVNIVHRCGHKHTLWCLPAPCRDLKAENLLLDAGLNLKLIGIIYCHIAAALIDRFWSV